MQKRGDLIRPRVLVVEDDDRLCRAWMRALRGGQCDATGAGSVAEAISFLDNRPFDVVLLDLQLPGATGEQLIRHIERIENRPAVAVVSGYLDSGRVVGLLGHCDATVPKPISPKALLELVRALAARTAPRHWVADFCTTYGLSAREGDVLRAASEGLVNKQIAHLLGCRAGTIATYWRRIFKKTGRHSQRDVLASLLSYRLRKDSSSTENEASESAEAAAD